MLGGEETCFGIEGHGLVKFSGRFLFAAFEFGFEFALHHPVAVLVDDLGQRLIGGGLFLNGTG